MDYTILDNTTYTDYNFILIGPSDIPLTNYTSLGDFVTDSFEMALSITVVIAVIYLIRTGFIYMLSSGDEEKIEQAQRSMIYTVVGLAIAFVAPLIVRFLITNVLKVV